MKMRKQMEALIKEMLDGRILLDEAMFEFEKLFIQECLKRNNDHITKTAGILGIHRNTLSKRIASYDEKPLKSAARRGT